jgi:hypothetical protein
VPLEEVKYRGRAVVRGVHELPVTWEHARLDRAP